MTLSQLIKLHHGLARQEQLLRGLTDVLDASIDITDNFKVWFNHASNHSGFVELIRPTMAVIGETEEDTLLISSADPKFGAESYAAISEQYDDHFTDSELVEHGKNQYLDRTLHLIENKDRYELMGNLLVDDISRDLTNAIYSFTDDLGAVPENEARRALSIPILSLLTNQTEVTADTYKKDAQWAENKERSLSALFEEATGFYEELHLKLRSTRDYAVEMTPALHAEPPRSMQATNKIASYIYDTERMLLQTF